MLKKYSLINDAYSTYHSLPRWLQDFFRDRHMTPDELPAEGSRRTWQEYECVKTKLYEICGWNALVDDLDTFASAEYYLSLFF